MSDIAKELYEVESEITSLQDKKSALTLKKRDMESKLQKLNNRVRTNGLLPRDEYNRICKTQEIIKKKIIAVEEEMRPINSELRQWNNMATELRIKAGRYSNTADLDSAMRSLVRMFRDPGELAEWLHSKYARGHHA